jgi:phosphoglycerate kinase
MANTFLFAQGVAVGRSLCERDMAETARATMAEAKRKGCKIVLPVDGRVARELQAGAPSEVVAIEQVPDDAMILDVGPKSVELIQKHVADSRTVVWNGPLGAFEIPPFDAGTTAVARQVAALTAAGKVMSVAGGGDTVAALAQAGALERFSYVSTAGGAFLEWLEGKELPGVAVLRKGK